MCYLAFDSIWQGDFNSVNQFLLEIFGGIPNNMIILTGIKMSFFYRRLGMSR